MGNVYGYSNKLDVETLRYSAGISAIWISPIGGVEFSMAKPFHDQVTDKKDIFQFSLGSTF